MQRNMIFKYKIVISAIVMLTIFFMYRFISISGMIIGTDENAERLKESAISKDTRNNTIEGNIVDCYGAIISSTDVKGKEAYCRSDAYSFLVGFNNLVYGSYGLRNTFEEYLLNKKDSEGKGATIQLTSDNSLQEYCYQLLGENEGSVIVLENETGAIRAFASRAEIPFDVNEINANNMERYNSYDGFWLANGTTDMTPPGSTFKVITASSAFENEMSNLRVEDKTGFYELPDGTRIHNYGGTAWGTTDIALGLAKSSNVYFAKMGASLGAEKLYETARNFKIGEEMELDFTTIKSSIDYNNTSIFHVTQVAFGQGTTQITPLHMGMITQSICSEGIMYKPYLIDNICLGKQELLKGEMTILSEPISKSTANSVKELMMYTAEGYGLSRDKYGSVGAKTGTAELASGKNQIYMIAFNEKYTIVMSHNETGSTSSVLLEPMKQLLLYLKV